MANINSINILASFSEKPNPIDYVLPNMVAGTVGAIVSPGGAGKSMLAMQLAIQIAGGPDLLGVNALQSGKVIYLPAEDPVIAIHHRLYAIGAYLNDDVRQVVHSNLDIVPLFGVLPDIMHPLWFQSLCKYAEGRRLMVLDTLRRFHIEDENNSAAMSHVIGQMERIASETGCSIVFLHHSNKTAAMMGAGDLQQASRGSSVLVDNIRWQAYLSNMTAAEAKDNKVEDNKRSYYVRFGVSKANYGKPFEQLWLERHEGGVLTPADFSPYRIAKIKPSPTPEKHNRWRNNDGQ